MKITVLLENTTCSDEIAAAHGLSLYIETEKHNILVDMGPDDSYLENAEKLGIDLTKVDVAFLSHGHFDHAGGLASFCRVNPTATIYLQETALHEYCSIMPDGTLKYVGVDPALRQLRDRFTFTDGNVVIDDELQLFAGVEDTVGAMTASAAAREQTPEGLVPDTFVHEQNLLVTEKGKTLLAAGCAHKGIVNILRSAKEVLGCEPDVTFGGFHLFRLKEGDPTATALIASTGAALLEGKTVYYTGHCTGDYAYDKMKDILGGRLQRMSGGIVVEI